MDVCFVLYFFELKHIQLNGYFLELFNEGIIQVKEKAKDMFP